MQQFKAFLKANQHRLHRRRHRRRRRLGQGEHQGDLFTSQFGQLEGLKVRAEWDPQIVKAITFLPEAQALEDHLKNSQKTTTTTASR